MTVHCVLQLSDLHLLGPSPQEAARIAAVRLAVERARPDLIVFSGDLCDKGPEDPEVLEYARRTIRSLGPPLLVIPGNHDIGNKISFGRYTITPDSLARWNVLFGDDRFVAQLGDWLLLGLNTQIMGSDWQHEAEQTAWFADQITQAAAAGQRVIIFMHTPPYLHHRDERLEGEDAYWPVDPQPRIDLCRQLDQPHVALVASGHLHSYALFRENNLTRLWAPSLSYLVQHPLFPPGGDCFGMIRYQLDGPKLTHELITLDLTEQKRS